MGGRSGSAISVGKLVASCGCEEEDAEVLNDPDDRDSGSHLFSLPLDPSRAWLFFTFLPNLTFVYCVGLGLLLRDRVL